MKLIVILSFIALAFAQDYPDAYDDAPDEDSTFQAVAEWPQNDDANGGALVKFPVGELEDGSCTFELPQAVNLFHTTNAHIVPGDSTNPVEGKYKVSAPAEWEAINETMEVLIIFARDGVFNLTEIDFRCDPGDVQELSVYSFPQNNLMKEASSNVHKRGGFHKGDVLTITLPAEVARFNITGADSRLVVDSEGGTTYTVSGFQNEEGIDDATEVHFSLDYLTNEDEEIAAETWFSAGQVTVSVTQEEPDDDEEEP